MSDVDKLWALVDQWRAQAQSRAGGPYLSPDPITALGQGLNMAAEQLSDLLVNDE